MNNTKDFMKLLNYASVRTLYMRLLSAEFPVLYTDIEERQGYRMYHVQLTPEAPGEAYKGLNYKLYAERS